ncbi:MAG: penicillin-binding protein 2 [Pyrinomonadaceae bacterium]
MVKRAKKKNWRQVAFTRFMLVVAVFTLWIGGISVRLVHLQVTQHEWLRERALDVRQDIEQTRALRGSIFDRNERTLAMSVRVKTLYADTAEITDTNATAKTVARVLNVDAKQLATQLRQGREANKRFVPLAKKLDEDVAQRINKALDQPNIKKADAPNFPGLHWRDDQRRSYPNQTLAAQVVGFANANDDGRAGVEQSHDDVLHGAVIKKVQERDRLGRVFDEVTVERDAPSDIVLTIDTAFQYMAEQALERGVQAADAKSGMAIVMNPKTGEILALANYPSFDPNTITESAAGNIGNKAIQSVYSPGSVFKIVSYGAGLERHLFRPDDMIDSGNGTIKIADRTFTDSHGIGRVTYSEALARSSNVCAIRTGMSVGREDFVAMIKKMGFGAKTGIELPAETQGIVRPLEKWAGDSLASMSIGYEIGVTALQMTTAFATIANDGIRSQPHIIKEIRHSNEQPKSVTQIQQTRVVAAETARDLRTMLRQVVLTGTGKLAQLNAYTSAGKTGTAWKFDAKTKTINSEKYVSSFIGMAPAENPEIVVAVVIDEPRGGGRDGGAVAAPIFRDIAQQVLTEMKVPTDSNLNAENLVGQDISEAPIKENKTAKKETPARPKAEARSKSSAPVSPTKEKPKDLKKTVEKKFVDKSKLTAAFFRRERFSNRTKLET